MFLKILLLSCALNCMADKNLINELTFGKYNQGLIAAFGDFNSDELTDAFIIKNGSNLVVYLAYDKEPLLRPSHLACNFSNIVITSVVPGDYDGDAYMDILLTTQQINDTSNLHDVRILWGGKQNLNCTDALLVKAMSYGQPLVLDYNHDMTLDVFGMNAQKERVFWIFNRERTTPLEVFMGEGKFKDLKLPHSHSFVDVNDDNAADLLVTTNIDVEVWLSKRPEGFNYSQAIGVPLGHSVILGQAVFLDVALSGKFYLVMPVCYDLDCEESAILIYDNYHWVKLKIDFTDDTGTLWRFVPPRNEVYLDTIMIRTGDYNMDGYPDILMTLSPVNSNETKVFLMHNVLHENNRTFEIQWNKFNFVNDVVMATFYDLYSDGVLDIIFVKKNVENGTYEMNAYRNELQYDTNFIKVIVVTGLTNKNVPIINRTIYSRKITFGTNLPGPKISYETWSDKGTYRTGVCAQLSQSAHFSLGLPYSLFGLNRTPNFVETLNVGLSGHFRSWIQIIPNSQIVVIPAPPDKPDQWRAELFVTPSKIILQSGFTMVAVLLILILVISCLHWKEKKDDAEDMEHIIN